MDYLKKSMRNEEKGVAEALRQVAASVLYNADDLAACDAARSLCLKSTKGTGA